MAILKKKESKEAETEEKKTAKPLSKEDAVAGTSKPAAAKKTVAKKETVEKKTSSAEKKNTERPAAEKKTAEKKEPAKKQYVLPHKNAKGEPDGWQVKLEGSTKATKVFRTKLEAEAYAKELAKKQGTDVQRQKKDGKFQKK